MSNLDITNLTKQDTPKNPFLKIKNEVLGENYELSLVFIGEKRSQELNNKYRGKDKPASVLSFPLEENAGEIFITLKQLDKKSKELQLDKKKTLSYLFIHGLLHLKGFEHGERMEEQENKLSYLLS